RVVHAKVWPIWPDNAALKRAPPLTLLRHPGVRRHRLKVVEIKEHRRALGGRQKQVLELAQRVRADDAYFIIGGHPLVAALAPVDVEMIEPEIRYAFFELTLAVHRSNKLLRLELLQESLRRLQTVLGVILKDLLSVFAVLLKFRRGILGLILGICFVG